MFYFWAVVIQIIIITLNAVFASAEIAVISMNESSLSALEDKGGRYVKRAKRMKKLSDDAQNFLTTVQTVTFILKFVGGAVAAVMFALPLCSLLERAGMASPHALNLTVCVIIVLLIAVFAYMLFGELIPRRAALKRAEKISAASSGFLCAVTVIFKPLVSLLSRCADGLLKLMGISTRNGGEEVTEEKIIMLAEAGSENGAIESEENQMIKNIFDFKELTVGEVCTHRKDADILFSDDTDEQWEELIYSTSHTYYPVCAESVDDVTGVLYTKEYFRLKDKSRENVLKNAVQTPMFVYENAPANGVFNKMKTSREFFAVVVDEYGGMAGIVTIHDLLEIIVGDMGDKDEEADYSITKIGESTWLINGLAPLGKVEDAIGVTLPEETSEKYETFGGYICDVYGTLPEDGSRFDLTDGRLDIKVKRVEKRCITQVEVTVNPEQPESEDE